MNLLLCLTLLRLLYHPLSPNQSGSPESSLEHTLLKPNPPLATVIPPFIHILMERWDHLNGMDHAPWINGSNWPIFLKWLNIFLNLFLQAKIIYFNEKIYITK